MLGDKIVPLWRTMSSLWMNFDVLWLKGKKNTYAELYVGFLQNWFTFYSKIKLWTRQFVRPCSSLPLREVGFSKCNGFVNYAWSSELHALYETGYLKCNGCVSYALILKFKVSHYGNQYGFMVVASNTWISGFCVMNKRTTPYIRRSSRQYFINYFVITKSTPDLTRYTSYWEGDASKC
jgi:hypothetical protein